MTRKLSVILIFALTLLVQAGCGSGPGEGTDQEAQQSMDDIMSSDTMQGASSTSGASTAGP